MARKTSKKAGKKAPGGLARFAKKEHGLAVKKFHRLVGAWGEHLKDEVSLHRKMLSKKHLHLGKHLAETVAMHRKFLKKLERI